MIYKVKFLPDEYFWGGSIEYGTDMPISSDSNYCRDFSKDTGSEMTPIFLSNKGRYIWSDDTFKVWVEDENLCFDGTEFEFFEDGTCLKDAYLSAMEKHFPFDDTRKFGKKLPREFFKTAQYNTWMEYDYNPTQKGVLDYAHAIVDNGFEPGILIIDEGWHTRYGIWEFDFHKFPNPKKMLDELHDLGFKVMLWVTPLVTPDGQDYIRSAFPNLNKNGDKPFLRNKNGDVAIVSWWNGLSAILDFRKDSDIKFLEDKLKHLMDEYGVDGFKFDGGKYGMYHPSNIINGEPADDHNAEELNVAWNDFGRRFKFHEYKDTFKGGGKATIQRLCDRNHDWEKGGINTILPCSILQGLMGYPFICPDMIGGGEWTYNILEDFKIDEELFIRMAQLSALFPMMQFSWAPWRVLSKESYKTVCESAVLHKCMSEEIIKLVEDCEKSGEPILRNLEYNDPHRGFETVIDEFMMGEDILVCPVIKKGVTKKEIVFPSGKWQNEDGNVYSGPTSAVIDTPLDKLLWFKKVE